MELQLRLQILKDAGQISEETYEGLNRIIDMFKNKWDITLVEENGAMLITHLSVAMERGRRGEVIEGIDNEIYNEIKNHCEFDKCKRIVKDISEEARINIPENEETFIMMHLCTLLETNKND